MTFPIGYTILSEDEIQRNNGEIIERCFYQYFRTKNPRYIYDFLRFIKNNAYPSWENISVSKDRESQIISFLLSRYTMVLLSFIINILNDVKLRKIINDSNILGKKIKSYIIKKYYLNIMNDSANILKNYFLKKDQIDNSIRNKYNYNSKAIIWGFKDRTKKFKSLFKLISLDKDIINILRYFQVDINNEIIVNGKKYLIIKKSWIKNLIKDNFCSISQGVLNMDIEFNKWKNVAEVRWGRVYGPLAGHGSTTEFTKKNNKWRISREGSYWRS